MDSSFSGLHSNVQHCSWLVLSSTRRLAVAGNSWLDGFGQPRVGGSPSCAVSWTGARVYGFVGEGTACSSWAIFVVQPVDGRVIFGPEQHILGVLGEISSVFSVFPLCRDFEISVKWRRYLLKHKN